MFEFDFSRVTLADYLAFTQSIVSQAASRAPLMAETVFFLDKVTVGGVRHLPLTALDDLLSQFIDALSEATADTMTLAERIAAAAWDALE